MWIRFGTILFFVVLLMQINAKPFLKNTVQSISSSISSASSPDFGNISDLRRRKSAKIQELSKYQDDDGEDDSFFDEDDGQNQAADDQNGNEVLPNLFQKKMAKIMRKLQFIAQLISRFNPVTNPDGVDDKDDDDFDSKFDDDEMKTESNNNSTESNTGQVETLDFSPEFEEKEEFIEDLTPEKPGSHKPRKTEGNLGVHFIEVLGSLFGLLYGAAIQLTNPTTAKPSV